MPQERQRMWLFKIFVKCWWNVLSILYLHTMLYDPTNNQYELDRRNGPSKEERCERLMKLDTMIAALIFLGRQLGQLLITRHKYGREM